MAAIRNSQLLEIAAFAVLVIAFFILGAAWAWRLAGLYMACGGIWTIRTRSIPVGIEGRPPSFYVRGTAAIVGGVLFILGGVLIALLANHMPGAQ
jgi:hypothetical protein